jgi:hypothetical protein
MTLGGQLADTMRWSTKSPPIKSSINISESYYKATRVLTDCEGRQDVCCLKARTRQDETLALSFGV